MSMLIPCVLQAVNGAPTNTADSASQSFKKKREEPGKMCEAVSRRPRRSDATLSRAQEKEEEGKERETEATGSEGGKGS